jgi:hypothetical protein
MSERRRETRKKLMTFTLVYDTDRETILGYLNNLTLLGAMVIGEKPLRVNTKVNLLIKFPGDLPTTIAAELTIPARVAGCSQDESPRDFMIGFEFLDVTPEHTQIIQALLDRYHFDFT